MHTRTHTHTGAGTQVEGRAAHPTVGTLLNTNAQREVGLGDISIYKIYRYLKKCDMELDHIAYIVI